MPSPRELFTQFLLGDNEPAFAAASVLRRAGQWPEAIRLAREWGVLPLLNSRLSALEIGLGGPLRADLQRLAAGDLARSALQARHGVAALARLEDCGIPAVAFKGLASLAVLHQAPRGRSLQDVDVLVREQDLSAAVSALEPLGFSAGLPGLLSDYVTFVGNSPGFAGNRAITLYGPDRSVIDIHWRLGRRPAGELLAGRVIARARRVRFLGRTIPAASPADAMVLAAHHALRNNFVPDLIMRDLADFRSWCDVLAGNGELTPAVERAEACRLVLPALALLLIWSSYSGIASRHPVQSAFQARATPESTASAGRLGGLFRRQLEVGHLNGDVLYLLRPSSWKQVLAGAFTGWGEHRRWMRYMEAKVNGAPLPLSRRLWTLIRSLGSLPPDSVRLLRTLAVAKDRCSC